MLAQLLVPPEKPTEETPGAFYAALLVGFIAFLLVAIELGCLAQNLSAGLGGWALAAIAVTVFLAWLTRHESERTHQEFQVAWAAWAKKIKTWKALEYCSRCGAVNDRASNASAPAGAMRRLLAG